MGVQRDLVRGYVDHGWWKNGWRLRDVRISGQKQVLGRINHEDKGSLKMKCGARGMRYDGLRLWLRLGLGIGLGLELESNPNSNPTKSARIMQEGRVLYLEGKEILP